MSTFKKEAQDLWPPGVPRPKAPAGIPVAGPAVAPKTPSGVMMPPMPGDKPTVNKPAVVPTKLNVPVQNMQKAIQELSRDIAGEKLDPQTKTLVPTNKNFNDFIGHHYTKSLEKPKEVNPDEPSEPSIAPTAISTQNVMQHLSGLDNNKVFKADGAWGPKTNEVLDNIYKFAYSLLQLAGDLGLHDDAIYNSTFLNSLKNKISGYTFEHGKISLDPDEQEKRAESIIKHVHAIGRLYRQLKQQISAKPELRSHIEDKKPFENYNAVGLNLSPEEDQFSKTNTNISTMPYAAPKLPNKRLDFIPVKSLRSKKDYLEWMIGYAGVPTEAEAIGIFNNFIKRKIEQT